MLQLNVFYNINSCDVFDDTMIFFNVDMQWTQKLINRSGYIDYIRYSCFRIILYLMLM